MKDLPVRRGMALESGEWVANPWAGAEKACLHLVGIQSLMLDTILAGYIARCLEEICTSVGLQPLMPTSKNQSAAGMQQACLGLGFQ